MKLTSKERMSRILKHQPVDRIGLFEVFWRETAEKWSAEGHFEKPEMISDHFGLDVRRTGGEITPGNYRLINLIGGMDERVLETNDLTAVRRELETKLPAAMAGSGYVLQVDHSVSNVVDYKTYKFFVEKGLEIGRCST